MLKNKSIRHGTHGLIIASSIEYNDLLESIDIIKYLEYPGFNNKTYYLVDLKLTPKDRLPRYALVRITT